MRIVSAESIAAGLGLKLIHWPVKSTTRAQDGLYVYDTVARLYDSQLSGVEGDMLRTPRSAAVVPPFSPTLRLVP